MLASIKDDIQDIHSENEKLKQEIANLGQENTLLKQAVNLPDGPEGEQMMMNTVSGLEAITGSARGGLPGSNVIWQSDVRSQREELRGEREQLLTHRAQLRTEASQLASDLQANMNKKFPASDTQGPLANVLEEYGQLCGETTDLQAENQRLKAALDTAVAEVDPEVEKRETDQLRRELSIQMLRYGLFPQKAEVPAPLRRASHEVKETNQYLKFKTKDMLGKLFEAGKPSFTAVK